MARREFLQLIACGTLGALPACTTSVPDPTPANAARPERVRGVCFDLFTLFNPNSVVGVAESVVPGQGSALCAVWRTRQFGYSWLRAAAKRYVDFERVTNDALEQATAELGLTLTVGAKRRLVAAYSEIEPWPDTRAQLTALRDAGLRLAPLSNYSPSMLDRVLTRAELKHLFDAVISTDEARTYKPDPQAYALGPVRLGLPREHIAFAAFGGWDAAGAKWFGLPTFWVNRLGVVPDALAPGADATGPTLAELVEFVGV